MLSKLSRAPLRPLCTSLGPRTSGMGISRFGFRAPAPIGARAYALKRFAIPSNFDPFRELKDQDKLLYTPGPLTTSYSVKKAMMRDLGSRDAAFINVIGEVTGGLLRVAGLDKAKADWTCIPMQGSGTFGVEAVLTSVIPKTNGGVLIISNGSYGLRMRDIAKTHGIKHQLLECAEDAHPDLAAIERVLSEQSSLSHVAVIHSETTSGIINDIQAIGKIARKHGKSFIVDAMSSFGAVPVDFEKCCIDYLVSSSNKCIEGVPGFSFVLARRSALKASKGNARTVSLDIHKQDEGFAKNSQFRFTPPTHAMMAFAQALAELEMEGGVEMRGRRYRENQLTLQTVMAELGFQPYLKPQLQGYIITSYRYPTDPNWKFEEFYSRLNDLNCVIYPGKVSNADCFRIGHIGRVFPEDVKKLAEAIVQVCKEMKTAKYFPKNQPKNPRAL